MTDSNFSTTAIPLTTRSITMLADAVTPVQLYLKLRDRFPGAILLESSDYHSNTNSQSFIGLEPIARFEATNGNVRIELPDGSKTAYMLENPLDLPDQLQAFSQQFKPDSEATNGLFGYFGYDSVQYFESIELDDKPGKGNIPEVLFSLYRYLICIDHFHNRMTVLESDPQAGNGTSAFNELLSMLRQPNHPSYDFVTTSEVESNMEDETYREMVRKGVQHCHRGDVFQVVLSRQFSQAFQGDEFNVYRALRSINPSPYLFYFDYGGFRIFGSSPETQVEVTSGKATIHPIAGTVKRTGNDETDQELAKALLDDPKENAEHTMLVDLARNDLSRTATNVTVETHKELQFFSHVIHMVSKVTGTINPDANPVRLFANAFPAGTLSGAPKVRAMQLINDYEPTSRGWYGGSIGLLGFNGNINQAILIRSFLSQNNRLFLQAGAGIVADSQPENELQEVNNKLRALRKAIDLAQTIHEPVIA